MKMKRKKQIRKMIGRTRDNIFAGCPPYCCVCAAFWVHGVREERDGGGGPLLEIRGVCCICGEYWWKPFLSLSFGGSTGRVSSSKLRKQLRMKPRFPRHVRRNIEEKSARPAQESVKSLCGGSEWGMGSTVSPMTPTIRQQLPLR